MIPVINLVKSLRFALKDMQGLKYSDYELIEAVNQAVSLLYGQLSEKYVYATLKRKVIIIGSSNEYSLPSDFVRIHQLGMGDEGVAIPTTRMPVIEGTYRIIGDTLYAHEGAYTLEYYYIPVRVSSIADNIDAPLSMSPYLEQISLAIFGNNLERAEQVIQVCINALANKEHSHFEDVGPVQVLGGKI